MENKIVTTFGIDFELWKVFQKKLIDNAVTDAKNGSTIPKGSKVVSGLLKEFLDNKLTVDLFTEESSVKDSYIAGFHIDESIWLQLDIFLAEERARFIGNKEKQKFLNKGNIIVKLIRQYIK